MFQKNFYSFFFLIFLSSFLQQVQAQDAPLYYIHSFNNQYFQNPAFAGSEGHAVVFLTYHKQLIGVLPNSPEHTSLTFHSPVRNSNSSVGFRVSNFRRSFLNTTGLLGSYALKLNFDPRINHNLSFGLSVGMLVNSIDAEILTEGDPAVVNRNNNRLRPDGQFGIRYEFKNLQIGATFPKIFKSVSAQNTAIFETTTPFRNVLLTAGYSLPLTKEINFKPLITYRIFEYEQNSGFEVNGIFDYSDKVWFGASYRERYGLAVVFGIKLKGAASVSYAYKVPNSQTFNYSNPAHEIQVALHLPKKQVERFVKDTISEVKPDTLLAKEPEPIKPPADTIKPEVTPVDSIHFKPLPQEKERTVIQGKEENDLPTSNYVVVGSFQFEKNAKTFTNQLRSETYDAQIGFNSINQRHYVFLYNSDNLPVTRAELEKIRSIAGFEEAWILKVEKRK